MVFLLAFGGLYLFTLVIMAFLGFVLSGCGYGPYTLSPRDYPKAKSVSGYFFRYWLPQCTLVSLAIPILFALMLGVIKLFF